MDLLVLPECLGDCVFRFKVPQHCIACKTYPKRILQRISVAVIENERRPYMTNTAMKKHTDEEEKKQDDNLVVDAISGQKRRITSKRHCKSIADVFAQLQPIQTHFSHGTHSTLSWKETVCLDDLQTHSEKSCFYATPAQITSSAAVTAGASANLREANQDMKCRSWLWSEPQREQSWVFGIITHIHQSLAPPA
jgi:hypothetical protein